MDFRHQFVRYRKKSPLNTRVGAEQYEVTLRGAVGRGVDINARPEDKPKAVTFAEFASEWFETYVKVNNKPSSQRAKRFYLDGHLLPAFGERALADIGTEQVERYKSQKLTEGLAPKTINEHLCVLGLALRTAREWGQAAAEPRIKRLRSRPTEAEFLTEDEATQLVAAADSRTRPMLVLALDTGIRVGELSALTWEDVDLARGHVVVRRNMVRGVVGSPKNNKARLIPLSGRATAELTSMSRTGALVFPRLDGSPFSYSSSGWVLAQSCRRAGLRVVGWHALRHTFASSLIANGASIRAVQELLGHSTIAMTERYCHVLPSGLRDTVALLPWATGGHAPLTGSESMQGPPTGFRSTQQKTPRQRCLSHGAWGQN